MSQKETVLTKQEHAIIEDIAQLLEMLAARFRASNTVEEIDGLFEDCERQTDKIDQKVKDAGDSWRLDKVSNDIRS